MKQFSKAKEFFQDAKKIYDELVVNSDDIIWKEKRFVNMADIAICDYMINGDITAYERIIEIGESLCQQYFLARCMDVLLRVYYNYIQVQNDAEKLLLISKKAITLINQLVHGDSKILGYKDIKYFYMELIDVIKVINLSKGDKLYIYEQVMQSINDYIQSLKCIHKSDLDALIYIYEEFANYLETIGMHDERIAVYNQIISVCKQYMFSVDHDNYLLSAVKACIDKGTVYEKKEDFEEAYNSYFNAVEIQKMQAEKDLYAFRRIYMFLNNCGRMKVMMRQYQDALLLYEEALEYIKYLKTVGIESRDGAEDANYEIITSNIVWLKKELFS